MSKIKIYELAKELEVSSKEVLEFLSKKNIEVKSHMSSIEDAEAKDVRNAFAKPEKPAEKAEEAPKKKNIVHVFRPQNTQNGARSGARRGAKGVQSQGKPMQVNNGRPAKAAPGQKIAQSVKAAVKSVAEKPAEKKAEPAVKPETKPVVKPAEKPEVKPAPEKPAEKKAEPTVKPVEKKSEPAVNTQNAEKAHTPARQTGDNQRSQNRDRQDRQHTDRPNRQGERRFGDRDRDRNNDRNSDRSNDRNGGRGNQNRQGERRFGDRDRDRNNDRNNDRNSDRNNDRSGGRGNQNRQGERRFGDRDRDRDRNQGRGGKRNDSSAIPAPAMDTQKPQRNKNKGKDDHKRKDYRRDEEERGPKGKGRKNEQKPQMQKPQQKPKQVEEVIKSIVIPEVLTIQELADKMKVVPSVIVKKLFMQGKIVTVNQEIDYDTAEEIALEFDILCEKEEVVDVIEELLKEEEEDEKKMKKRPPVVCVMGHVDHGKTSLLDAIRHTNVIGGEAGGITQHIGAYVVDVNGEKITFLDTPGHEAFTAMRMRGASSTDIAILVVAADDGVMPQTVEAINHAKAAGVEIIVAVNKIDKPSANVERVKQELTEYELIPEDWGGSTIFVPVSAKTGEGLEDLMEMIILTAEVMELKANPNRRARGLVLEAQLDKGRGSVATVLVQKGTLRIGDAVAAGSAHGKVRAMMDDKGRRVKEAGPSVPVEILGLNDVPNAGEVFVGCGNDKEARNFAETFISQSKVKLLEETKSKLSLDDLFNQIQEGNLKELGIVVKADVQGSVEAIKQSLLKLSNDEVVVKIIHGGVGAINESDVSLASASNAIIIGFNVRPDATAKETADREGVDIRLYRVIYNAIEDVQAAMKGMLDPVFEEKVLGHAEVRQTFKASGVGTIAGSYVMDGTFERDCSVRITRDGIVVFEGALASLRRFKDDVKEVRAGYECGFVFANFNDVKEGDQVEAFKMVEIPR